MENLPFVIWTLLFPICINASDYWAAKVRILKNEAHPKSSSNSDNWPKLICLIVWIFVALKLYV